MNLATELMERIKHSHKRVVVIGDAMVDYWVAAEVHSCQEGCPKLMGGVPLSVPGGAANAVKSIEHWGIEVSLHSFSPKHLPHKWRFVGPGGIVILRWDDETRLAKVDRKAYRWSYELGLEMCQCASGVLLSDYDKGYLTPEYIRDVVDICRYRDIPCVADCKRAPPVYERCILKSNHLWAKKWNRCDKGVVTWGKDAPMVDGVTIGGLRPDVPCVNHVGAGDCFAAHLTLALAYGYSLKEAAALAHSAGRVYVQHPHNRAPLPSEVAADAPGSL